MRRYLIKWYPVYPCDYYEIADLDILKSEYDDENRNQGFKNIRASVQQMYYVYQYAVERSGLDKYGKVGYNNSWWMVVEADNIVLANDIFKQKLEEEWEDHESRQSD